MRCTACGTENEADRKFCAECGSALARMCAACGTANAPSAKYCGECGSPLAAPSVPALAPTQPAAERRLVSVLFADLVGFTTLSETRDSEEVRELLTRYFDTCRRLIGLYGGTVEKFIGDAVMAVWGTPVATEDDAERAVRAALDLVTAVPELEASLRVRAGVLTGEAAVTLGAEGEGMVAGDLVNTASRIQAAAEPGTVLVGEATRRASEAAIAYEEAGAHELKGKLEPMPLWRALRVTAARGGALKSAALEPPFVGRDRELRLVKDLFHASAEQRKPHRLTVLGVAGTGKSRLAWEFEKYIDGLLENVWWHRGRCLAYGEGVAYWALAEMVRMRARIVEEEPAESALAKLRETLEEHATNAEERDWLEPRLAQLLGLSRGEPRERDDVFPAWRLFFERLADQGPCVLVFEDLHWADTSLLEFVDYLLEWSRDHPLFVLALARPDLAERRPTFVASGRSATTLSLEPLPATAMDELLGGLVPGLPAELRERILERAQGVPLYAVETVRMLLDRGLVRREGELYRPTAEIDTLAVPETLQALVAARLDGLEPDERRLLQDASVLGKTFTKAGLAAVSGADETDVEPVLARLVRKELLSVQADPRSPERGQYGFVQDLLQRVAYETLARPDRKLRHLAAARHLERAVPGEQEVVEVVAAHYLDAYRAAPDAPDAAEIRSQARTTLARAGERAASLAAGEEAERYFEQAAELAEDALERAELLERAGVTAWSVARSDQALKHLQAALAVFESADATHPAARVSAYLAEVEWARGRLDEALERMERAYQVLAADEPDADLATLAAQLGRLYFFRGKLELAEERIGTALSIGEALRLPEVLSQTLSTLAAIEIFRERYEHSLALVKHGLELALENGLWNAALRAYANLGETLCRRDRLEEAVECYSTGLALARRVGNRNWEWALLVELAHPLLLLGRWDEAVEATESVPEAQVRDLSLPGFLASYPAILHARGRHDEAAAFVHNLGSFAQSTDVQARTTHAGARAELLRVQGRLEEAAAAAAEARTAVAIVGAASQASKLGYIEGLESALALSRHDQAEALVRELEVLRPGIESPFLRAQARRFRARLAWARGEREPVEPHFGAAEGMFREFGMPFWLAVVQLEHAEWLLDEDRADEAEPLLEEARAVFERLGAAPWLARLDAARPAAARIAAQAT